MPLDKILVVTGSPIGSLGNALESPQIQTPLKGLVLLAGKVARHDFRTKLFLVVHLKAISPRKPRDNVRLAILFGQVEHLVEFPWELQQLATAVSIANGAGGGSHRTRRHWDVLDDGCFPHQSSIGSGSWRLLLWKDRFGFHLGKHLCLWRCSWNRCCWSCCNGCRHWG